MRPYVPAILLVLLVLQANDPSQAQTPITKLNKELIEPRGLARTAAALYPKIYFGGGDMLNGTVSDAIDIYDNLTNTWDQTKKLSVARDGMVAVASDNLVFFAGGRTAPGVPSDVVDIFDAAGNRTTTLLPGGGRYYLAAAYNGDSLVYFAGGNTGSGLSSAVDIYHTRLGWLPSQTLTHARESMEAGTLNGKVYFIGGENSSDIATGIVEIFSDGQPGIVAEPITELRKWGHVAVSTPDKIFVAGGYNGSKNTNKVDIISSETGRSAGKPLSLARHILGGTTVGGLVFFAGGRASVSDNPTNNGWSNIVDVYDLALDNWTTTRYLSEPRHGLGAVALGTKAFFAGGFRDISGAGYSKVIDVYDPEIVLSNPILPDVIQKGTSTETASVTVDDLAKVKSVEFVSAGITDPNNPKPPASLSPVGNVFTKTFTTADLTDPVGIIYSIRVKDYSDRIKSTEEQVANIQYAADAAEQKFSLTGGTAVEDYRIISVPLRLSDNTVPTVFDELAPYDTKQWRLYDYVPADSKSRELNSPTSKIEPGKGYWLITRNAKTISPGVGTTAQLAGPNNELYTTILLKPGWNLIGNPYNFALSWSKILAYNGSPSDIGPLYTFNNGNISMTGSILSEFGGGFVENQGVADFPLKVPAPKSLSTGGRVASPEQIDLNAKEWQFPFSLTNGKLTNSLGGVGMHTKATLEGRDDFDGVAPPMLDFIGMFEMAIYHPEVDKNFCLEMVPTNDRYQWEFQILNKPESQLKLEWDPQLLADGDKELYLYDPDAMEMKDMRTERYYIIPSASERLVILFGDKHYIRETKDELLPLFGRPYPNPSSGEVYIPVHVDRRAGSSNISVVIYDGVGRVVQSLVNSEVPPGDHQLVWSPEGRSGLFIVELKGSDEGVKRVKLIVK